MNAVELLKVLERADVQLEVVGDELRYDAPPDALTDALLVELREQKAAVIEVLRRPAAGSPVLQEAMECATSIKFSANEPADILGDIAFLARIRQAIERYPGENFVYMRIRVLDGSRPLVRSRVRNCVVNWPRCSSNARWCGAGRSSPHDRAVAHDRSGGGLRGSAPHHAA